jgi:hypothetical protein
MSLTINGATNTLTAASGLAIAGNTAVTGTLSASSTITSTVTTDIDAFQAVSATTTRKLLRVGNTGGETIIGIENSVGGGAIIGSTAYDGVVRSKTGIAFSATEGLSMQMRLSSTGLAVTGTLSASGITSVTDTTDATSTTAASLKTAGGLGVAKKAYFGDNIVMASGKGIDFSATSDGTGASSVAEILDDYETGTFTPSLVGGTTAGTYVMDAARTTGSYTKVGNTVHVRGVISVSSVTSAGTGAARIYGLPFGTATVGGSWARQPGNLAVQAGPTLTGSSIFALHEGASNTYLVMSLQGVAAWSAIDVTDADTVGAIWFFDITYKVG